MGKCPDCFSKNIAWRNQGDPQYWCCDCFARFNESIVEAIATQPKDEVVEKVDILKTMQGIE